MELESSNEQRFDDDDEAAAEQLRTSVVNSFQTLLSDLATIVANRVQPKDPKIPAFDIVTIPTVLQQRALDLLGVTLKPPGA